MRCSEKYPRKNKTQKIASRKFTPWEIDAQENCPLKNALPLPPLKNCFTTFLFFFLKLFIFKLFIVTSFRTTSRSPATSNESPCEIS